MSVVWFIIGAITVLAWQKFGSWRASRSNPMTWYEWLAVAVWYVEGLFTIAMVGACLSEGAAQAAGMSALIFGLIFVVFTLGLRLLLGKKAKPASQSPAA